MFSTLRYDKDELFSSSIDFRCKHSACITCRSKKLRCSGEKDGCRRCVSRDMPCRYMDTPRVQRRKRRKLMTPKAAISRDSQSETSASSTSATLPSRTDQPGEISTTSTYVPSSAPRPETLFIEQLGSGPIFGGSDASSLGNIADSLNFLNEGFDTSGNGFFPGDSNFLDGDLQWPPNLPAMTGASAEFSPPSQSTEDASSGVTGPCTNNCTAATLTHLSALALSNARHSLPTIPKALKSDKLMLAALHTLLSCPACISTSALAMTTTHITLLLIFSQHLITSYELILSTLTLRFIELHPSPRERVRLLRQARERGQNLQLPESLQPNPLASTTHSDMDFGGMTNTAEGEELEDEQREIPLLHGYAVDPSEEPCVFSGLVTLQLKSLRGFLGRVKMVLRRRGDDMGDEEWEAQVGLEAMVEGIDGRVKAQLWICGACGRIEEC